LKNIEVNFIFFARLLVLCASREDTLWGGKPHSFGNINVPSSQATLISRCRCEKYRSKLHIFRSFVPTLRFARRYTALAVKNIEASFIFFARLFLLCASREDTLWGGKPHSFGNINVPSSQATLISRCHCKKY